MKNKILKISAVLFAIFFVLSVIFFLLMKKEESYISKGNYDEYDTNLIVEKIEFLKLNTYDDIEKYTDEHPICIQSSNNELYFGIGDLSIEENPVKVFYKLNEDKTIKRVDGYCTVKLDSKSADSVSYNIKCFNNVVANLFGVENFGHDFYDENGVLINNFDEQIYKKMFEGKAKLGLSVIDENSTYWYVTITVSDKEYLNVEFFRCFDLSIYEDHSPNIDLRVKEETGE